MAVERKPRGSIQITWVHPEPILIDGVWWMAYRAEGKTNGPPWLYGDRSKENTERNIRECQEGIEGEK